MDDNEKMELIYSLAGYPDETEWLEFKENDKDADKLAKDVSALANSAAYHGREYAYKIWGVKDGSHDLVGTSFRPQRSKAKGNQDLLIWLRKSLTQNASYEFEEIEHHGKVFVVLRIRAAFAQPVYFEGAAFIREGSSTTRLVTGSAKEAELWRRLQASDFEQRLALEDVRRQDISGLLNIDEYFSLLKMNRPENLDAVIDLLCEQDLIRRQDNGRYAITNLGALLVARQFDVFPGLRKRPLRIVRYAGKGNFDIVEDRSFNEGYCIALPRAEEFIMSVTPASEVRDGAFRRVAPMFPQRAVRELLSNTVIHQDLADNSSGPLVGIYENRLEFSNPGASLIPARRILNAQPKTRNNALVRIMRQMDLCEEGGTGWDLAVSACEAAYLAAPKIETSEEVGTRVTLYGDRAYDRMTKAERKEALYWHACLLYAQSDAMGNRSARERFGMDDSQKNTVAISRLIRECCDDGLIREVDEESGTKYRRYIPAWA